MTRFAFFMAIGLLAGCGEAPLPQAQAHEVYASIRRAEAERARARSASVEQTSDDAGEKGQSRSQL